MTGVVSVNLKKITILSKKKRSPNSALPQFTPYIVAGSQEEKCGLKYLIHTPRGHSELQIITLALCPAET
jgi:hypothetical protein